jgi:hypothetical protein
MKTVFLAFFLLNFCQPQAATLQLSGIVPEKSVVQHQHTKPHPHFEIHPRKNSHVHWAPLTKENSPQWNVVHKPVPVKGPCRIKVSAL